MKAVLGVNALAVGGIAFYLTVCEIARGIGHAHRRDQGEHEHRAAVEAAQRRLKAARREHDEAVRQAQAELESARRPRRAGSYNTLILFDDHIESPDGCWRLTPDVLATVETDGDRALPGRAARSRRAKLHLVVKGSGWSTTVECSPGDLEMVRRLAQHINIYARCAPSLRDERDWSIQRAWQTLEQVASDRTRIEQTEAELAAIRAEGPVAGTTASSS